MIVSLDDNFRAKCTRAVTSFSGGGTLVKVKGLFVENRGKTSSLLFKIAHFLDFMGEKLFPAATAL